MHTSGNFYVYFCQKYTILRPLGVCVCGFCARSAHSKHSHILQCWNMILKAVHATERKNRVCSFDSILSLALEIKDWPRRQCATVCACMCLFSFSSDCVCIAQNERKNERMYTPLPVKYSNYFVYYFPFRFFFVSPNLNWCHTRHTVHTVWIFIWCPKRVPASNALHLCV